MKKYFMLAIAAVLILTLSSCETRQESKRDLVNDNFTDSQAELKVVLKNIYDDAMTANTEGLTTSHLISPKFTKLGPRSFERQTAEQTNDSEASFFSSISDLNVELKDIKIDVFGDVAVTTFYPHFTFMRDGSEINGSTRQTLVFLKTDQGWKIIHEHGTPKKCFTK